MPATVLCVQRDRAICDVYCAALEAEGYETFLAHDGCQALEILRRQNPDFVILDAHLSKRDGFEILAELRGMEVNGSVPVLMLCDTDITPDLEQRARQLDVIQLLRAPLEPSQLIARVAEFVKPEPRDEPAPNEIPETGSLGQTTFPELMHGLHVGRRNCVLLLEDGRKKKGIEFRDGRPTCIRSNIVSECLGQYLVKIGRCSREQVDESLQRMRSGEGLQGEILVAMEILDEAGVVAALEDHALEKLFEIFDWPDGQFQVRSGVRIRRGSSTALGGHPANLIVQGVRRKTPMEWIDRFIETQRRGFLVPSPGMQAGLQAIDLEKHEVDWLLSLDGSLELEAVGRVPESIRRLIYGLISVELLRVEVAAGDRAEVHALNRSVGESQQAPRPDGAADDAQSAQLAQMAKQMQDQNHFAVLGVSQTAGDAEVRQAFGQLVAQVHPNNFHDADSSVRDLSEQVFDRVRQALEGVATLEARSAYFRSLCSEAEGTTVEHEGQRALIAEAEFQNGEMLLADRNYMSALVCFGRAMEHFPSQGEYRSFYGWCLYLCHPDDEGMFEEALEHCRKGLKLAKEREKPYLLLGRLYKVMGKSVAAKKMFTRALRIRPQCVEAMRELRIMEMRHEKDNGVMKRIFRR
jgi:CheY-like chemotaxis protein